MNTTGTDDPGSSGLPAEAPFSLLARLYADREMMAVFSEEATVAGWLRFEAALAAAQADLGVITREDAEAIAEACQVQNIDMTQLWREAANVGYPILPLVRQLAERLPEGPDGRVHLGATTQDVMDTGLALQLGSALDRLDQLLSEVGDLLCGLVESHRDTLMAARTHGQQAVPTTFGAKLAVYLGEFTRQRQRFIDVRPRVARLSLFGAGGTSAGYGDRVTELRRLVAEDLGLYSSDVPWHVARDALAEYGFVCAATAESCARFAREVIDLSRTEIGEVREADGYLRGASSTMPQKANPILSEGMVGLAISASAISGSLLRAMEAGHERAAGEWQAEWEALPRVSCLAAAALATAVNLLKDLRVDAEAMRRNLDSDGGAIMAEAYMLRVAALVGRERAHELVYAAVRDARTSGRTIVEELIESAPDVAHVLDGGAPLLPEDYLGDTENLCHVAVESWRALSTAEN